MTRQTRAPRSPAGLRRKGVDRTAAADVGGADADGGAGCIEGFLGAVGAVVGMLIGAAMVAMADEADVRTVDGGLILIVAIPFAAWGIGMAIVTAWDVVAGRVTGAEGPARGYRSAGQRMTIALAALVPAGVALIFTRFAAEYAGWAALFVLAGYLALMLKDWVVATMRRDATRARGALLLIAALLLVVVWVLATFELRAWLEPWAQELGSRLGDEPAALWFVGVAFIVGPVVGMLLVLTSRSRTGITGTRVLGCGVVAVLIAVVGLVMILSAVAQQAGSTF